MPCFVRHTTTSSSLKLKSNHHFVLILNTQEIFLDSYMSPCKEQILHAPENGAGYKNDVTF